MTGPIRSASEGSAVPASRARRSAGTTPFTARIHALKIPTRTMVPATLPRMSERALGSRGSTIFAHWMR